MLRFVIDSSWWWCHYFVEAASKIERKKYSHTDFWFRKHVVDLSSPGQNFMETTNRNYKKYILILQFGFGFKFRFVKFQPIIVFEPSFDYNFNITFVSLLHFIPIALSELFSSPGFFCFLDLYFMILCVNLSSLHMTTWQGLHHSIFVISFTMF